ncbi:hypothetical protein HID58_058853 [Brassica napus]|uniref:Uncharacterized protein n=1 Tax=Brassica napus TaxID=3708 RepID=A0ABQ7ZRT4_BRANA|nr:hypothetical protein HID58_058853 [Brassica napus]
MLLPQAFLVHSLVECVHDLRLLIEIVSLHQVHFCLNAPSPCPFQIQVAPSQVYCLFQDSSLSNTVPPCLVCSLLKDHQLFQDHLASPLHHQVQTHVSRFLNPPLKQYSPLQIQVAHYHPSQVCCLFQEHVPDPCLIHSLLKAHQLFLRYIVQTVALLHHRVQIHVSPYLNLPLKQHSPLQTPNHPQQGMYPGTLLQRNKVQGNGQAGQESFSISLPSLSLPPIPGRLYRAY